jgi:hypothetical protein
MDADEKSALHRLLDLTEENNKILRKLYRGTLWHRWVTISYWVIIIGLSLGAFYFIQPYLDTLGVTYGVLKERIEEVQSVGGKILDATTGGNSSTTPFGE